MRTAFGLAAETGAHRRAKIAGSMREMAKKLFTTELHKFRVGRANGHIAHDDFAHGVEKLRAQDEAHIRAFLKRTMRGDVDASTEGVTEDEDKDKPAGEGAMGDIGPYLMLDGVLIVEGEDEVDDDDERVYQYMQYDRKAESSLITLVCYVTRKETGCA